MKKYLLFIPLSLASAFLLTACGSDADDVSPDTPVRTPIYLAASLASPTTTRGTADIQTTEFPSTYTHGVGVYIYRDGKTANENPDNYGYTNIKYDVDATSNTGDLALATGTTQPYYPNQKTAVDVYAYAPYQTGTAPFTGMTVEADQSTDANYTKSDFVSGKADVAYDKDEDTKHEVTLSHRLSRIKVVLVAGSGVTNDALTGAQVVLNNISRQFDFAPLSTNTGTDLIVSNVTVVSGSTDVTMGTLGTATAGDDASRTLYAVVPPQTIAASTNLFTINLSTANSSAVYTLAPSTAQTFDAGKQYTYTITLAATALSLTTTITDWDRTEANQQNTGTASGTGAGTEN
jgi:hypothetical protein